MKSLKKRLASSLNVCYSTRIINGEEQMNINIYGVHISNDKWPEDRSDAVVIVAAPNKEEAVKAVKEYGEPLTNMHSVQDVEEINSVETALDHTTVITYFLS